ncbi:hypothetical protein Agabi119p4_10784 [Agaricus bisporus var. burnettii]|uniref:Ser-Thr-rich glycosyl-phosphatidyl-inositol-anchored membrane family-domain-containing protein n=1 Tax=Agaricus bisporus var. burnettii TaxID=192524 RepID=A0A8H7C0Q0_AGABI|nr:hypothetical protein Agabi119p4_10784 [Agaricus bisporus var. burnettii]
MAYYHLNKNYLSGVILLVILCHLSGALAALYPTQPVAKTVFATGSSALVTWKDDTHVPHVYDLGDLVIKLYTAQAVYVATLALGVNPNSFGTQVTFPADLRNDTLYFLTFRGPGLQRNIYTANFAIVSDPTLVKASSTTLSAVPPVQSLLADGSTNSTAANMNLTSPGQQMFTSTTMLPVSTVAADQYGSPYRNNGAVHSRASQLEQAKFRLLFVVWPIMFGLSMAF